jgi:hypothetical protein
MPSFDLQINGQVYTVEAEAQMPLLWALRDLIGLTGTKFSCGMGLVRYPAFIVGRQSHHHHRRPVCRRQSPTAKGMAGRKRQPVRVLPAGTDHERRRLAG